jgi:hypothetical protein
MCWKKTKDDANKMSNQDPQVNEKKEEKILRGQLVLMIDDSKKTTDSLKNKCQPFTLEGDIVQGYCISVYDGDTCTVNLRTKIGEHEWKIRMQGYDSPEIKSNEIEEKKHAKACKEMLKELIQDKHIWLHCGSFDKYGRLLGTIYLLHSEALCVKEEGFTKSDGKGQQRAKENEISLSLSTKVDNENLDMIEKKLQCVGNQGASLDVYKSINNELFINVNEWMIKNTPCCLYEGKTKSHITFDMNNYCSKYISHYYNLKDGY